MPNKTPHRAYAVISTDLDKTIDHAFAVAIIWKLIGSNRDWHKQQSKPFSWYMEDNKDGTYSIVFSSIFPSDTRRFVERLKEGSFQMKDGTVFHTETVIYLEDPEFDEKTVELDSINCQCFRKVGHKRVWKIVRADEEPGLFEQKIVNALRRRAEAFLPNAKEVLDKPIRFAACSNPYIKKVQYKGSRIETQSVDILLEAPKEIQEIAVYGGIGREPSSGFGFVMPLPEL